MTPTALSARLSHGADAAQHPTPQALKAAGIDFLGIYLYGMFAPSKAQVNEYLAAELGLVSIFEFGAQNALGGSAQGITDARAAVAAAGGFGQPHGTAIYYTVDFDPAQPQFPAVIAYGMAFTRYCHGSGYKAGVYGGTMTLRQLAQHSDFSWQAAGWSYGIAFPANLRQEIAQINVGGVSCDQDTVLKEPFGAWCKTGPWPPAPKPSPLPATGDDMQFLAKSPDGPATLCYDIGSHTCYGIDAPTAHAYLELGIKDWGTKIDKAVLAEFKRVG